MRRDARVDDNQKEIVKYLRGLGASVAHTHTVGSGFPDIIVGYRGSNVIVEIKDGSKPASARSLTAEQHKFHAEWRGDVQIVETQDDCMELMARMWK